MAGQFEASRSRLASQVIASLLGISPVDEQLLLLDRQAILGKLSAGLVHAINNVLSGVLGQVDLLLLTRKEPQIQSDLEQIANTCDQGVLLTRSLTRVISTMSEHNPTDPVPIVDAVFVLLGRIYRRAGVEKESATTGRVPFAVAGHEFVQALFHLVLLAYEALAADGVASRKVSSNLSSKAGKIVFELTGESKIILPASATRPTIGKDLLTGVDWQIWVLDTITKQRHGEWHAEADGHKLTLIWPAG